ALATASGAGLAASRALMFGAGVRRHARASRSSAVAPINTTPQATSPTYAGRYTRPTAVPRRGSDHAAGPATIVNPTAVETGSASLRRSSCGRVKMTYPVSGNAGHTPAAQNAEVRFTGLSLLPAERADQAAPLVERARQHRQMKHEIDGRQKCGHPEQ